mgnify:CR=1 FL=1
MLGFKFTVRVVVAVRWNSIVRQKGILKIGKHDFLQYKRLYEVKTVPFISVLLQFFIRICKLTGILVLNLFIDFYNKRAFYFPVLTLTFLNPSLKSFSKILCFTFFK